MCNLYPASGNAVFLIVGIWDAVQQQVEWLALVAPIGRSVCRLAFNLSGSQSSARLALLLPSVHLWKCSRCVAPSAKCVCLGGWLWLSKIRTK